MAEGRYDRVVRNVKKMISQNAPEFDIDGYLRTEGLTPAQFKEIVEGPSIGGQIKEGFKGLVPGAIGLVESAAIGASALLPDEYEAGAREAIESAATTAKRPFAAAPGYEDTVGRKLGEAVGSTIPFLATGPLGLAGRVGAVGLGVGAGAGEARTRAEREGATEEERAQATALGIGPGALEVFAPFRILKRLDKDVIETGVDQVRRALIAGGEEAAQEAASGFAQNLIARGIYKPEQELIEGLGEQAAYGGATGAILQGLLDLAIGRRARGTTEPAPPPPGTTETETTTTEFADPALMTPAQRYVELFNLREGEQTEEVKARIKSLEEMNVQQTEQDLARIKRSKETEEEFLARTEPKSLEEQIRTQTPTQMAMRDLMQPETGVRPAEQFAGPLPREAEFGTTFTPEILLGTGLKPQSGFFRQLVGKDLSKAEDQAEVSNILQQVRKNNNIADSTKNAIEQVAQRAFGALATQAEMFGPRGGVRAEADMQAQEERRAAREAKAAEAAAPKPITPAAPTVAETAQTDLFAEEAAAEPEAEAEIPATTISEKTFQDLGIAPSNKKLREQILGKDLTDPTQVAEVKDALEDFANAPNRSEKLRTAVEGFLAQPVFEVQAQPAARPVKETADVTEPRGTDTGAGEPSVLPPVSERAAPGEPQAPVVPRMEEPQGGAGVAPSGAVGEQRPLKRFVNAARKAYDRVKEKGDPEWDTLSADQQNEFMDAFAETKPTMKRYRLAAEGTKGMPIEKLQKLVARLTEKWKNPPDIFVLQSIDELEDYGLTGIDPLAKGVFYGGDQSVFLIADNITDYNDAVLTIAHESIGHFGLQSVLGDKYNATMDRLYETNADVRARADKKMAEDEKLDKRVAVEEVLAEAVEEKIIPSSGLGRAISTLRNLIRNFFKLVGAKASNSEIDALIAQAANYVVGGTVQVNKAVTNTDAFKDWFGGSVVRNRDGSPKIMYHGTAADITEFQPRQANAIFVTDDPEFAAEFSERSDQKLQDLAELGNAKYTGGPNIMPVYVHAENPFDYENPYHVDALLYAYPAADPKAVRNGMWSAIEGPRVQAALKDLGFDSFYVMENGRKNLAVYEPNQVKSATGNVGTFRRDTGDIRLSKKGFRDYDVGYHSGDLGYAGDTTLGRIDGGRGTGHFGTGVYFTGSRPRAPESAREMAIDPRAGRPVKKVNFGEFNLLQVRTQTEAAELHDALKLVNRFVDSDLDLTNKDVFNRDLERAISGIEVSTRKRRNDVRSAIIDAVAEARKLRPQYAFKSDYVDSASTRVMKKLGYDGIDVRGVPGFDNTTYGSVIYAKDLSDKEQTEVRYRKAKPALTAAGQEAQALLDATKGIANEKARGPEMSTLGKVGAFFFDPSFRQNAVDRLRVQVAYKGASVERKLLDAYNGAIRDSLGNIRPDLFMTAAEHSDTLTVAVMKLGRLVLNKTMGWVAEKGPASMTGVMDAIKALGQKLGDQEMAFKLANNAFIARRAKALKTKDIVPADLLPSDEKIAAGLEAFKKFPELEAAFKEFTDYKNGLIDAMVEGGRLSKDKAQEWKDAADYVPWNRIKDFEESIQNSPQMFFKGLTNLKQMKAIKGGTEEINDIFDNMVGLSFWMVNSAVRNHAALQLTDAFVQNNLGAKRVRPGQPGVDPNKTIFIYRNGEPEVYEYDSIADVYAFKGVESVGGPLLKSFTAMSNLLRKTTTAMPQFAASQLFQDAYRATTMSGVRNPFRVAAKVIGGYISAYKGDATTQRLEEMGIVGMYDLMPGRAREEIEKEFGLKQRSRMEKAINAMESFSIASDAALRKAVFEQTLEETKSEQFPEGDVLLARYRAQEIINFKRQGANRTVGVLRQMVPFMNAYIQGMDVFYRSMTGRGISAQERSAATKLFWATGVKLMTLSLIYSMLVGDDDEYKGLRDYEKDKNFIFPGTGIKIPVAPEVGFLFKVLPERTYNYITSQGTDTPQDATALRKALATAAFDAFSGPNLTPQAIKPLLEIGVNYSFFTGSPIVGRGLENREARYQFTDSTSELAKFLGDLANVSPLKIDYFLRGTTGIAGGTALDITNMMFSNRPERNLYELPGFKTFMYDKIPGGYKEQYYDLRNRVDQVADTMNALKAQGRVEELDKYLSDDKLNLLALRKTMNRIDQKLEDNRKYKKLILNDPDLSSKEKTAMINEIEQMENEMLQAYNIADLRKNVAGL